MGTSADDPDDIPSDDSARTDCERICAELRGLLVATLEPFQVDDVWIPVLASKLHDMLAPMAKRLKLPITGRRSRVRADHPDAQAANAARDFAIAELPPLSRYHLVADSGLRLVVVLDALTRAETSDLGPYPPFGDAVERARKRAIVRQALLPFADAADVTRSGLGQIHAIVTQVSMLPPDITYEGAGSVHELSLAMVDHIAGALQSSQPRDLVEVLSPSLLKYRDNLVGLLDREWAAMGGTAR